MSNTPEKPPKIRLPDTDKELPKNVVTGFYHYSNFEALTEGGAATLHSCFDKNLCRRVVIKRLHPHLKDNPMEQRRFLREARVTAQIAHPATVPLYELGRDDKGDMYFTMKKLEGDNLRKILERIAGKDATTIDRFPLPALVDILVNVSQAVAFAHDQGVIHRDLKPANIVVGGFGEVMLLDWGLAKVFGEKEDPFDTNPSVKKDQPLELTRHGQRYGTPLYMSPEQAAGITDVDERADIYNLGIILYEILSLKPVVMGQDLEKVLKQVREERPLPPSQKSPERSVPPELEAICMKALEKKAEDRYETVQAFIDDLHNYQRDIPVSVHLDSMTQRILKWRHRHMVSTSSIIGFLLGVLSCWFAFSLLAP